MELPSHPDFLRFWIARVAGGVGAQILMLAIGWHMYQLTGSAWDLGLVGLLQFLPAMVMTLPAGQVADRFHRLRVVQACQAGLALVALVMVAASAGGWASRGLLFALSIALGAMRPLQVAASQSLIPALVPYDYLPKATALSAVGFQAATVAGPAIGGVLFAGGFALVYGVCAGLFAAASALMFAVRYDHVPPPPEPVTVDSLLAGIGFVRRNPIILGAMSLDLFAVLLGGATALLPIYAEEILHVGPQGLGVLRAAPAIGALATAAVLARRPLKRRVGHKLLVAVAVFGGCIVVFGVSRNFWLSLLALAGSGAADMVSVVVRQTLVQLDTPDPMRGRVSALNSLFIGASNQLGEFESGATAAWWGPVASVVVGGLGTIAVALLWARWFRPLAARDRFR